MQFAWPSFDQAEQYCTHSTQFASCLFTQCLAYKVAFKISAPVNGRMNDWFIRAQILK